jgi:hypothetical protein
VDQDCFLEDQKSVLTLCGFRWSGIEFDHGISGDVRGLPAKTYASAVPRAGFIKPLIYMAWWTD